MQQYTDTQIMQQYTDTDNATIYRHIDNATIHRHTDNAKLLQEGIKITIQFKFSTFLNSIPDYLRAE